LRLSVCKIKTIPKIDLLPCLGNRRQKKSAAIPSFYKTRDKAQLILRKKSIEITSLEGLPLLTPLDYLSNFAFRILTKSIPIEISAKTPHKTYSGTIAPN